ncbi:hypothetical protein Tcan_06133 [Toxocara canis]|uniref:Uncharacterized protein n=1 Tax=Toxocara canis TaxID=6265 RepID=A0A0B2V135_TOXCA|nr:hypothetical protein Tcan_06133 [Toxocara canis]
MKNSACVSGRKMRNLTPTSMKMALTCENGALADYAVPASLQREQECRNRFLQAGVSVEMPEQVYKSDNQFGRARKRNRAKQRGRIKEE